MPTSDSDHLATLYASMSEQLAEQPSIQTTRSIFERYIFAGKEPTSVTYEEVADAGGCSALWSHPHNAQKDRVILYFHGGGFMTGSPTSHRKLCGHLGKAAKSHVLAIHYRLAPEHPFPAQLEDSLNAYRWLLSRGYEPGKIAFAGDSAGGNLVSAVCLKILADGGKDPLPVATIGFSPWTDMQVSGATIESNAEVEKLAKPHVVRSMRDAFLGYSGRQDDPLANLLLANNDHVKKLPPTYVVVGTYETLQDDGERWANKVESAGVETVLERCEGMQHVHVLMAGKAKEADDTIRNVAEWLEGKFQ